MTKRSSKSTKIKKPKKNKVKKKSNEKKPENSDDGAWETDEEEELDYNSESATEKEEDERADSSLPNEEKHKSNSDKSQKRKISAGNTEETSEPSLNGCSKNVEEEKSQGSEMAEQVFGSQQQPSDTANFSFTGSLNNNEKVNKKKKETLLKKSTNVTGHPLKDESKTKEQTKATEDSPSIYSQVLTRRQSAFYNSGYGHQYGKNSSYDSRHKLQQDISSKNPCFVDIVIDRKQVVGVNFVVAAPLNLIDDSDMVVVRCGHPLLGNWKQPLIELHKFEKISELFGVYSGKINIPEELLRSPLQYKYLVLNEDGIKFWEFLHKKNVYENRILTFQSLEGYEKHFHYQFDDIIMPEKSIGSKLKSWLKSFYKEDDLFSYLPDVFECYANNLFLKTKSNVTKSKSNLLPYKIIGLYKSFFSAESQMREYIRTPWQKLESTKIFVDWVNNYLATVKSVIVNVEFDIKDRIQTYTDVLLMLCGLVNCGCQMDKLVLPLCDILSLNPFCCANDILLEELRSILQHHIDIVCNSLEKLWKMVKINRNIDFGEKWIHPLALILLFNQDLSEKVDVAKNYWGLSAKHVESVNNDPESFTKIFKMCPTLQKIIIFSLNEEHFAFALKNSQFNRPLIIKSMTKCIEERTIKDIRYLCNALEVFMSGDRLLLNEEEFIGFMDMLRISLKKLNWKFHLHYYVLLTKVIQFQNIKFYSDAAVNHYNIVVSNISTSIRYATEPFYNNSVASGQLLLFNIFISWKVEGDESNLIQKESCKLFSEYLKNMVHSFAYITFYNELDLKVLCSEIQEILFRHTEFILLKEMSTSNVIVAQVLDSANSSKVFHHHVKTIWDNIGTNINALITEIFNKKSVYQLLTNLEKVKDEELKKLALEVFVTLKNSVDLILSDMLEIKSVKLIVEKRHVFMTVCEKVFKYADIELNIMDLNRKIESFETYWSRFSLELQSIKNFVGFIKRKRCGDVTTLQGRLETNMDDIPIKDCLDQTYLVNIFSLKQMDIDTLKKLCDCEIFHCKIFQNKWEEMKQQKSKADDYLDVINSLEPLLYEILYPAIHSLGEWVKKLFSENIDAAEIKNIFKNKDINTLKKELNSYNTFFDLKYKLLDTLLEKVECLRKLDQVTDLAGDILETSKILQFKGDFNTINEIYAKRGSVDDLQLTDVNEETIKHSNMLNNITDTERRFLDTVSKCLNLVIWVREELKDRNELKKFVDFISNSGETSFEVQRVKCFDLACKGLEILIFDTNESSGFEDLVKACSTNIRDQANTDEFFQAIIDTNRHLEWFKRSYESLGSVVETAFMKAQDINRRGYYIIGLEMQEYLDKVDLKDFVIKLVLPDEDDERFTDGLNVITENDKKFVITEDIGKIYQTEDIDNLQSLLILLGDSKMDDSKVSERDYFIKICNTMKDLANVFVDLIQVGCLQMFDFQYVFRCDINDPSLKYSIDKVENLSQEYDEQKSKIEITRLEEPLLNYFSIKQCVVLQKYLADLLSGRQNKLSYQAINLLASICNDIDENKIEEHVQFLFGNGLSRQQSRKKEDNNGEITEAYFENMGKSDIEEIIDELIENGASEEQAYAALMAVRPFEKSEALIWCIQEAGEVDDDEIEEFSRKAKHILEEMELSNENDGSTIAAEEFVITHTENSKIEKDFLQINHHIKYVLGNLSQTQIADLFEPKPYLFTVEKDEIIETVLHLYYESFRKLPNLNNVLYCTKDTTLEEVELIVRKAMSNSNEIFSLMFIEELDFRITKKAVEFIQEKLQFGIKSPLLLFCSNEKEYNNLLVSSFAVYHATLPLKIDSRVVRKNFKKCLVADKKINEVAAYDIAPERSICSVVSSHESGMGKSFQVKQKAEQLRQALIGSNPQLGNTLTKVSIPIHGNQVNVDEITTLLLEYEEKAEYYHPKIYHFDISPTVEIGVESFLFNLVVLGAIQNKNGVLWRKKKCDAVFIEVTLSEAFRQLHLSKILEMLPQLNCNPPSGCLEDSQMEGETLNDEIFRSEPYQRVYQYLAAFDAGQDLNNVAYSARTYGNKRHCLATLIRHCGINDPSWMEINNFVKFLNQQLQDCEESNFCNNTIPVNQEIINGFKSFVVKCCLKMSEDFATRSVNSEEQNRSSNDGMLELKRKWENSTHPYLFFNHDHSSFSFVGFNMDRNGNLLNPKNGTVILRNVMTPALYQGLSLQLSMERDYINFSTRFNELSKAVKLKLLCRVMGIEYFNGIDPDPSFVLTSDNVQKILAIHMRLRANIPVIMSGETGCGKTKLIKYMTSLLASGKLNVQNLVLAKIHGGTTFAKLRDYLGQAIEIANNNLTQAKGGIDTILFFDECNTSEAVGLIKEIMIDSSCFGKPVDFEECRLKIVAAINPYRRHTAHMIKKLECSGLGYYNENEEELERLGKIPLRQLVYRVHKLPDSLKSIVWDYGQLNEKSEQAYIEKIVSKEESLLPQQYQKKHLVDLLVYSQKYMRKQKDECSFVSLRDVERAIKVLHWFRKKICFFEDIKLKSTDDIFKITTLLTLSVCYISRLENRTNFISEVPGGFTKKDISYIEKIQRNIAKGMVLEKNIALNKALCENIFMMLVCIELRIPLFVVGKPGSSKSLAKTIIQESLQGKLSKSEFCHDFKQIFMASYQCSVLSTAEGIISTFRQCSEYQQGKDLDSFASVVVLDEVGLAEDSPKMPLKALHPLLEDGTDCSEDLAIDERKKNLERPAFIGLSNFAIDPAKMNRGIMLSHPTPDLKQLYETASELCESNQFVKIMLDDLLKMLAKGYLNIYKQQKNNSQLKECKKLEFFGLRDYYSLVKEIFCMSKQAGDVPSLQNIKIAIQRNFSGLENFDSWLIFAKELSDLIFKKLNELGNFGDVLPIDLIEHSLRRQCPCYEEKNGDEKSNLSKCYNSRYLLLLTEEFAALDVVQNILFENKENVDIIFGSSFPKDQEFTQVYRDITHIKMCMETGRTVVLLNMENLYESLYDALNQYYVYFGGQKYVDLGLGVHRVKCRVHNDFRLIVIADVNTVYKAFPIPLINRLEKHFVLPSLNMSQDQQQLSEKLDDWAKSFSDNGNNNRNASQAFPGFNQSTSLAIISNFWDDYSGSEEEVLKVSKMHLIQAATPDAIIRYSDTKTSEARKFFNEYLTDSRHFSLMDYINWLENSSFDYNDFFSQITTFSRLLAENDVNDERIHLLHLKEFQTKSGFEERLKRVTEPLQENCEISNFIVIQCTNVQENQNLVNCAKHICGEFHKNEAMNLDCRLFFIFILQLNHSSMELKSWQAHWTTIHIDELKTNNSAILKFYNKKLSEMFDNEEQNREEILQITSSCIQSSVKDLNDQNKMDNESIKQKINILQTLLNDYQVGFTNQLFGFIKSGLREHEKFRCTDGQEKICADWVQTQAKKQCEKTNYSTFNKSLTHTIEEFVRPLLTEFLTKCDVNSNLLLLNSDSQITSQIWMTLFEQEIYNIQGKYSKVEDYKCLFPFSTNLVSLVDEEFSNTEDHIVERVIKIENALNQRFNSFDISREEQSNYIYDFLHMKLSELCRPQILQILGKALHHQVDVLLRHNDDDTSIVSMNIFIACVKLLFDQYESRFNCTAKIASLKKTDLQNVDVCYDDREMTADVLLLEKFFQSIWPDKRFHLLSGKKGFEWTTSLKKLKPLMISMCELNKKKEFSEIAYEIFNKQRLKWTKLRIFQLFNEIVVKDFESFNQQCVTDFFKAIEKLEDNLESENSWKAIHAAIDNSMQVSGSHGENDEKFLQKRFATFYIDLVSEFSFNRFDCLQVEDDVIDMLMGQVFSIDKTKTKMFSPIRDYKLDESYTIRSFLLKQLFRMKKGKQLNQFLEDNLTAVSQQENCAEDYWMICNLFLFTCEDHTTIQNLQMEKIQQQRFITHVATLLEQALPNILHSSDINAKILTSIAEARYALTIACNYLCQFYVLETLDETLAIPLERLFNVMEGFCNESEAHYFCLRYIMKTYGMNAFKKIVEISEFAWLELQKDEEGDFEQDMFLVYGNVYKEVRDQLQDAIVDGRTLSNFLEENGDDIPENIRTMCLLKEILFGSLDQEIREKFCNIPQLQQFLNRFNRTVDQANDALKDLLIHFETLQNTNNFATEIIRICNTSPQLIKTLYLPAMPTNDLEKVRNVPGIGTWYECPNGHPYVITNCGNPNQSYNCNICNARIGAAIAGNSALAANNRRAQARDLTRHGYCVGNAVERSPDGTTERHLKSSSVVLQRFIIHLSLYRLALVDQQAAIRCITLPVGVTDARRFFEEHLQADINILSKIFALNSNDVNILLHMFLQHLQTVALQHQGDLAQLLTTQHGRGNYEDTFDRDVIAPFLQGYQDKVTLVQNTILNDMDKSRDPKFRKLHQLSVQHIPEIQGVELLNNWKIWQIHKPISYSHFLQYVEQLDNQNNSVECKTLKSFLQKEEQFELIQNLPYLVRFQKLLFSKFNYKYSRKAMEQMKAKDAEKEFSGNEKDEFKNLLSRFCSTWNSVSKYLQHHRRFPLEDDECPKILKTTSSFAYFICSRSGPGRCAIALIDYLAFLQHDFIDVWKTSDVMKFTVFNKVNLMAINESDVISYSRDKDFIPLLYGQCNYAVEVGRAMKIDYDLESIEKQLVEKVFFGASLIDIVIEIFVYLDDVRTTEKFNKFSKSIPQEQISIQDGKQICFELGDITDLTNSLKAVEISIGFLSVTHGENDMKFKNYVENILQMDIDVYIKSPRLRSIQLKHLISVWLSLTVESCLRLHKSKKIAFEFDDRFRVDLDTKTKVKIKSQLQPHRVRSLIDLLTEYIVFKLNDAPDVDFGLFETLQIYEDQAEKDEKIIDDEMVDLPVLVKHTYFMWKILVDFLQQ